MKIYLRYKGNSLSFNPAHCVPYYFQAGIDREPNAAFLFYRSNVIFNMRDRGEFLRGVMFDKTQPIRKASR